MAVTVQNFGLSNLSLLVRVTFFALVGFKIMEDWVLVKCRLVDE